MEEIHNQAIEMSEYINNVMERMYNTIVDEKVNINSISDIINNKPKGTWSREVILPDKPLQIHSFKYKAGEYQSLMDYIKEFNTNSENLKEGFYPFKLDYRGITPWVYHGTVVVYVQIPYLEDEDEYMVNRPILSIKFTGIAQDTINIIESLSFSEDLPEYLIEK